MLIPFISNEDKPTNVVVVEIIYSAVGNNNIRTQLPC